MRNPTRGDARRFVNVPALAAVAFVALAAACERPSDRVVVEVPRTEVRDSAGVRLVSAGFARDSLLEREHMRVLDTLLDGTTTTGEGAVGLVAVQPLPDSSLVLFSGSGPTLLRYRAGDRAHPDTLRELATGTLVGENAPVSSSRTTLLPFRADTLLLWNGETGTLAPVTAAGVGSARPLEYPAWQSATVSGVLRDGRAIAVAGTAAGEQDAGVSRAPLAMLRFAADGARVDTILVMRGPERAVQLGRPGAPGDNVPVRTGSVPFGRTTLWSVGSASVLTLDTERCHIERRDADGVLRLRLDFHCAIEAVTAEERAKFLAGVLRSARSRSDSAVRRRFVEEASFPPSKSTASGLLTDAWDRIWLRLPEAGPEESWTWWVFSADGMPIVRFSLDRPWRIAAVRERDLIAVSTDRDDAPPAVVRMALPDALHRLP